jgi:hypothetical protein
LSSFDSSTLTSIVQSDTSSSSVFGIRPQVLSRLQQVWEGYQEAYDKIKLAVHQRMSGIDNANINASNYLPTFLITENE